MDPLATLRSIDSALSNDDIETANEFCEYLADWINHGGFEPDWAKYPEAAEYFREIEGMV